jgi:CubicO group peptidase (beta-lactamase class C family)
MKKTLLILLVFVVLCPAFAQDTEKGKFAKLDSLLSYYYDNGKMMGSLTIRVKGSTVFEKSYGFIDVPAKTRATADSKYKAGQATEMFTAAVVLQLVEEKKLALDTKLSTYFPKIANADAITVRQLLNHTSGIADYTKTPEFDKYKDDLQNRRGMLEKLYELPAAFTPDIKSQYSAGNYLLLGYIVQDITGKTIKENIASRIIKGLGLKNTGFFTKSNPKKKEAYSYYLKNGQWERMQEWHESVAGGALGLQTSPNDLTKFIGDLFSGKVVKKETLALMTDTEGSNGLGMWYYPFAGRRFMGQAGAIEGFTSIVCYYPKENMGFSLMLNAQDCDVAELINGILSIYYKQPFRFPNFRVVKVDEAVLKSYEGRYATPSLPYYINVNAVDGQLRIYAEEQGTFYVTPLSNTSFTHDAAGIILEFGPDKFTLRQNNTSTIFTRQ